MPVLVRAPRRAVERGNRILRIRLRAALPLGLVSSADEEQYRSMGMDSGWFTTFLDAFVESVACVELPIWKVIKVEADGSRTHLTDEDAWDATWRRIYKYVSTIQRAAMSVVTPSLTGRRQKCMAMPGLASR